MVCGFEKIDRVCVKDTRIRNTGFRWKVEGGVVLNISGLKRVERFRNRVDRLRQLGISPIQNDRRWGKKWFSQLQ